MLDEAPLNDLIGQTYAAATGDEDWTTLLEQLMRAAGGKAALLRWHGRPIEMAVTINMDLAVHETYDAYYRKLDPFWPLIRRLPPGSAVDERTLMPDKAIRQTEFYRDFMVPNGLEAGLSWYGLDAAVRPVALYIVPSSGEPARAGGELDLLRALAPHLNRALRIEGRLAPTAIPRADASRRTGPALSHRERDCLARVADGASSKGVARQLALSVDTVNEYIGSAMRKLQASSRAEAVATALLLGLLNL